MSVMKRKAVMEELAKKAKELFGLRRFAACEAVGNAWVKLATCRDMARAPKYLRWKGRIS